MHRCSWVPSLVGGGGRPLGGGPCPVLSPHPLTVPVITSPQGPPARASCLGGEQEANFRHGDSLPTAAAAGPQGALDTALQVCSPSGRNKCSSAQG